MTGTHRPLDESERGHRSLDEDPADVYEDAPVGYVSATPDGRVVKVNRTLCAWTGRVAADVVGARLTDLFAVGSRVFHETNVAPLLRMRGAVREIAVDVLRTDGSVLPCLLNAVEVRDDEGQPLLVRATLFEAADRRRYEEQLLSARRKAERLEHRARTLHELVSALAAAVTVDDVAAVVVERGRAALRARGAALVLLGGTDGDEPTLGVARSSGLAADLLAELEAAARGRLVLTLAEGVRPVPLDEGLRSRRPAMAAAMQEAALTGLVVVPVSADSHYLGVLVIALGAPDEGLIDPTEPGAEPVRTDADLELLATLGRQAGQALERARLHEETARQAQRSALLLEAARLMAEASSVTETVQRLADLTVRRLATAAVVDLVGDSGPTRPAARHADPDRQALLDELREAHLPGRHPVHPASRALADGRTHWVRRLDEAALTRITTGPRHAEVARRLELVSLVSVPLRVGGRVLGAITLGNDSRRGPFTPADVEVAEQLALQVAQVLDKAQRYEFEAVTSHTLQAFLLPPAPPSVPGLSVAVRYVAASHGVDVGGDFYDVAVVPGSTVALAVGDVVGHDITAAATMGQLRSVYRAMLAERPEPAAVVDRLQKGWPFLGLQRMATALFATLDLQSGCLRLASAGHPPPVLIAGGRSELLPVPPAPMLGAPPSPAVEWAAELVPGATLLLFTDGLVESRTTDIDAGLDRVLAVAAEAGDDPDRLCDRLLADLAGDHRADDIALLALTRAERR
ncbi:SpoIIE family protein phosphatase [Geodermatophilus sp. YIM 151500]|uniref:SpoIIE family protein phosphatase n=1 Tax=Geodermatophilus sp. YIM 151500 TaxID=2984531 RepID=UPI0021E489FB|nr:SpoIIE family protein phosphatase [Geodermatophilus sp. YIM 151500]MCV2488330.1 SpoIIE family protein phosphatase [Geodermatophilus sp. YIM 151500]